MLSPNERPGFGLELAEAAYKPEKAVQAKPCESCQNNYEVTCTVPISLFLMGHLYQLQHGITAGIGFD